MFANARGVGGLERPTSAKIHYCSTDNLLKTEIHSATICIFLKHNEGKKKVALVVLFKKVGSNRHFQNEQICHEGLCNILNLKKKGFQTFEIFV